MPDWGKEGFAGKYVENCLLQLLLVRKLSINVYCYEERPFLIRDEVCITALDKLRRMFYSTLNFLTRNAESVTCAHSD